MNQCISQMHFSQLLITFDSNLWWLVRASTHRQQSDRSCSSWLCTTVSYSCPLTVVGFWPQTISALAWIFLGDGLLSTLRCKNPAVSDNLVHVPHKPFYDHVSVAAVLTMASTPKNSGQQQELTYIKSSTAGIPNSCPGRSVSSTGWWISSSNKLTKPGK